MNLRSGLPIEEIATTNRRAVAVIDLAVLMHPTTPQAFASNTPRTAPGRLRRPYSRFFGIRAGSWKMWVRNDPDGLRRSTKAVRAELFDFGRGAR